MNVVIESDVCCYFRKALVTMADASAKPNRLWSVNTVAPTSQTAPMN